MHERTNDTNKRRGPRASVSQEEAKRIFRKKKRKRKTDKLYFVRMWDRSLSFDVQGGDRGVKEGGKSFGRREEFLAFRGLVNLGGPTLAGTEKRFRLYT